MQMFDVALSRRMCCSRVASAIRYAVCPWASTDTPMMRPGIWRTYAAWRRMPHGGRRTPAARRIAASFRTPHPPPSRQEAEDREREKIGADCNENTGLVRPLDERPQVLHDSRPRPIPDRTPKGTGPLPGSNSMASLDTTWMSMSSGAARPRNTSIVCGKQRSLTRNTLRESPLRAAAAVACCTLWCAHGAAASSLPPRPSLRRAARRSPPPCP